MNERYIFPGFIDVHVHFRDPGGEGAETTASGLAAAAAGGIAAVVTMPNTTPAIDSPAALLKQFDDSRSGTVRLYPSAAITRGRMGTEVGDLESLAAAGAAFFTDDGAFVRDDKVMEAAMKRIAALGMVVSEHALAPDLTEAEAIARDLSLCRTTGCRLHIQHLSTAAGVELVRDARKEGLKVTAEATPHHLLFTREDIPEGPDGGLFKMAPPLATREDRAELRRAVKAGELMFATDHAPHPEGRKRCGYATAANGIIGLESAVAVTYAAMVEAEGMSIEKWAEAWWKLPRTLIRGFSPTGLLDTVLLVGEKRPFLRSELKSLSSNCPFVGRAFSARAKLA